MGLEQGWLGKSTQGKHRVNTILCCFRSPRSYVMGFAFGTFFAGMGMSAPSADLHAIDGPKVPLLKQVGRQGHP